jgi:hypothetical protein
MEQQPGRDNEQKGFAGLNALISDVTNDIPVTAEAVPGKPSAEPSPQPTASDTGQVLSQQPAQAQLQHETDFQSSGSGSFGFYLLIASAIFFLWLIHSSNEQHSPSYSPPSETISLQPPPPQGIATFDDLIPKASETISTQPPPSQSSATQSCPI